MCGRSVPLLLGLCLAMLAARVSAAPKKQHVIVLGKWNSAQWNVGTAEDRPLPLKVRALYVDDRLREFTLGEPHDVTDRLFVVRRAFRLNDQLPADRKPRWRWERGGWLMVKSDRDDGICKLQEMHIADIAQHASIAEHLHKLSQNF